MTLKPSIYLLFVPVYLTLAVIACTGQLANMQIRDEPVYVCPTSTPRPTHTPRSTDTQPDIHVPPSGWATHTPEPGCYWNGVACVPHLPAPGGIYTEPGYTLPGATSTPRPTHTPYPTPTPYVIRPPQDFYAGDAVHTGGWASDVNARFRLTNIATHPATADADGNPRQVVTWSLIVTNLGDIPYEFVPAAQVFVSQVGGRSGVWGAGEAAAEAVGLDFAYTAHALPPGETVTVALAAYTPAGTPAGTPAQFTYLLDPTQANTPNTITWTSTSNPHCAGDVLDPGAGGVLPTPRP